MYAQIFWIGANVMDANISWARIFHGREYFMGANISWARIFRGANILEAQIYLIGSEHFDMRRYFEDVRIHFLEVNIFVCKVIF